MHIYCLCNPGNRICARARADMTKEWATGHDPEFPEKWKCALKIHKN